MQVSKSRKGQPQSDGNGAKTLSTAIETRFAEARSRLGPHRQQLIRAIVDHCEETCFLSSRDLAKRYKVDAATVVRTVQALGYRRFADFAADLREHLMTRVTPYTVLKAATRERASVADHVDHSLDRALDNLNLLRSNLNRERVVELAKLIHRARRVVIVGADFAASLAYYFAYGLVTLGFDADAPIPTEGNLQHQLKILSSKDLLIGISFGQCLRVTVDVVIRARKQGVHTFGITDSDTTPIARYSERHLVAGVFSPSFLNSYVAPMALINAIHVACAHLDPKRSLTQLKPTDKEYLSGGRWYREPKASR
ncbi:MAG TPA: MurR/RpiR family transcriptional regulator [Blastocatellia bacterium]|nr:MurR/RpiR family transcriptional regulator [Blastocatellia bacterium]